jgi:acyl carrier protein
MGVDRDPSGRLPTLVFPGTVDAAGRSGEHRRPGRSRGSTREACNETRSDRVEEMHPGRQSGPHPPPPHELTTRPLEDHEREQTLPAETHVEQSPLNRQEVLDLVRDRLADILEIEPSTINEADSFADDLDADSLALIELVEALEEELGERSVGFRIEDEDLEDLKTIRDAVDYVMGKLG